MGKVKITKNIVREIQTKKFEQVTITVGREEELEFKSETEKNKKIDTFTKDVIADFTTTFNKVCEALGVQRCVGMVEVERPADEPAPSPVSKRIETKPASDDGLLDF